MIGLINHYYNMLKKGMSVEEVKIIQTEVKRKSTALEHGKARKTGCSSVCEHCKHSYYY